MKDINKPTVHSTEDAKLDKAIDQAMKIRVCEIISVNYHFYGN